MALLFTLLLGGASAVLGYFSYYFNQSHFVTAAEDLIAAEMKFLLAADSNGTLNAALAQTQREGRHAVLLLDASGRKLGGNLLELPQHVAVLQEGTLVFTDPATQAEYAARIYTFGSGAKLLVGIDVTQSAAENRLLQWLTLLSMGLMALVVFTSFLISTFVVGRTNHIASTAQQIMETGDLSRRIALDSRWDDLSNMAYVLNLFLGRVEQLVQGIGQVSDNIAHDLRTPLTRLLNSLENLRQRCIEKGDDEAQHSAEQLMQETEALLATFNALLRISRIETGRQKTHFSEVALAPLLLDVADLYEPLAEAGRVSLALDLAPASCFGDRDLLFQIFANLMDNALKFTPPEGVVTLSLRAIAGGAQVELQDTGPGIPPSEQEKVFERFYRMERSRTTPGSGLGLSLVAAAIGLHEGHIRLSDAAPGLRVSIFLPLGANITKM